MKLIPIFQYSEKSEQLLHVLVHSRRSKLSPVSFIRSYHVRKKETRTAMNTYSQLSTQKITELYGSYIKVPYSLLRDKNISAGAIDTFLKLSYCQSNGKFSTLSVFSSIFKLDYKLVAKYTKVLANGNYISDGFIVNDDESFFMMPTSFVLSKDNFRLKFYKMVGILDKSTQTLPVKNSTILKLKNMLQGIWIEKRPRSIL